MGQTTVRPSAQSDQLKQHHDVPGLIAALGHPFPWIRRDAAQMLGQIKELRVRTPLTAALTDRDSEVRHAAQDALERSMFPLRLG